MQYVRTNTVKTIEIAIVALFACIFTVPDAFGQLPPPDKRRVFIQDSKEHRALQKKLRAQALKPVAPPSENLDFQAPNIELDREHDKISGSGGVTISQSGTLVQADKGTFDTTTKAGTVEGDVVMTTPDGVFSADNADVDMESETGDFRAAEFTIEEGGYKVEAERAQKISEFEFALEDASLTTCHCADGGKPWEIVSNTCDITQEGYAHTYDTKLYFEGVPILYTPWLAFPVKTERASGLLVPQWGYGSQDGVIYSQPIFIVADDSTDFTLTPFIETKSRMGAGLSFRKAFSTRSNVDSRIIYSDESRRGSNLRGLNISGYADPTIDSNRFGGFYNHIWRPDPEEELPIEFLVDSHYTSDDLFIREIEDDDIGQRESQYLVSTAVLRGLFFEKVNAEGRLEYNQMIVQPDETQFQRLPELVLTTSETVRPFGYNPYGLKLVASGAVSSTDFVRETGYDGWRVNVRPRVSVPFHIQSYVRGQFAAELHQTQYYMNDTVNFTPPQGAPSELEEESSRTVPIFGYGMSTGVERIYDLERGNWFSDLIGLGAENEGLELARLKHTIEPTVQFTHVPYVKQYDRPQFDGSDRIRERSVVTYGVTQRLYGRMLRPYERSSDVGELTASPETLPTFDLGSSLLEFGRGMTIVPERRVSRRSGEIRELATFNLRQSYDAVEDRLDEEDPTVAPQGEENRLSVRANSDVNMGFSLSPSKYFAFGFASDVNPEDQTFSRYDTSIGFRDDRGDILRTRYSYINETDFTAPLSQIEGNLEVSVTDRLKLGYYARYDEADSEMLESRALVRYWNSCKCWSIDVGVSDRINPDRQQFLVTFTFAGLGDITQNIGLPQDDTDAQ